MVNPEIKTLKQEGEEIRGFHGRYYYTSYIQIPNEQKDYYLQ
jgi:biotin operon repressor